MDEQKRLLLAVVLSVVVLVGYQTFFVQPPVPNNQPVQIQEQSSDKVQENSPHVSNIKPNQVLHLNQLNFRKKIIEPYPYQPLCIILLFLNMVLLLKDLNSKNIKKQIKKALL